MPDQPDGGNSPRHDGPPPSVNATPVPEDSDRTAFSANLSFGAVKPLPADVLSPDAIDQLRSGGALSDDEIETLRAAASADSGMAGTLLERLLATGFAIRQVGTTPGAPPGLDVDGNNNVEVVPVSEERFVWSWKGDSPEGDTKPEPATYYEALTGKPDPMRGFFVTGRRILNIVTWIIALGLPLGLIALGIVIGESPDTIFFMGFAGLIVGMMIKESFPKTPFG